MDWDNLEFAFSETKSMYIAHCKDGKNWQEGAIEPFGDIPMHPAATVLHYGQGIFEGMKAQKSKDGEILLFRPEENAKRFQDGARRLAMPEVPVEMFVNAVHEVVKANEEYVPPYGKGTLYIRPVLWGTGPILGVAPSPEYMFVIFVCPVGPYFKGGMTPKKMVICKEYHRAAPRGIGGVKAVGNYSATIMPGKKVKAQGFAENIFLNAGNDRNVEEVGAANFFCVKNGELHTPRLTGSILPGITRESLIQLAREQMNITVQERDIDYEELPDADEIFCSGTAAIIAPIGSITIEGTENVINNFEVGEMTRQLYDHLTGIQKKDEEDPYGWVVPLK